MRLRGKVALITGAARGMGAAEARLFAREGAKVGLTDVLEDEGRFVETEIVEAGGEGMFLRLDVTSAEEWGSVVDRVVDRFDRLDILVNNAGIYHYATLDQESEEDWDRVMDVNAKGVFLGMRAVLGVMRRGGGGSIVNISSTAGLVGSPRSTAYNASKGAVRLLTKSAAVQYAKEGIRVNSVHPGLTITGMTPFAFPNPGQLESHIPRVPLGRSAQPEEIAYGALFLASDESSYMTGSELVIDGGWTAQ